jgi:hypothetical protein
MSFTELGSGEVYLEAVSQQMHNDADRLLEGGHTETGLRLRLRGLKYCGGMYCQTGVRPSFIFDFPVSLHIIDTQ